MAGIELNQEEQSGDQPTATQSVNTVPGASLCAADTLVERCSNRPGQLPRKRSVRFRLTSLVLACILPACIIAFLFVYYSYQYKRALLDERVLGITRALSTVVDRQLSLIQSSATALATSPNLATGDLGAFYKQAQTVLQGQPDYVVVLSDSNGQELVDTGAPFGKPLPVRRDLDVVRTVFTTGKPVTSNLYKCARTGVYAFSVHVPVFQGDHVVYDMVFAVHAADFQKVISRQHIPPEWSACILDANKVMVARSRFPERFVGRHIFPAAVNPINERLEGTVEAPGPEGTDVFATFSRSAATGWTVVVAIPKALIWTDIHRWLMWVVGGIILLSTVALLLALFYARRISGSIQALVSPALVLGRGGPVQIGQLDLSEADNVGQSLVKASQLLQERTTERDRVEGALRLSEEKFATAFAKNQAAIGITRLRDGVFLEVNDTFVELSGYSWEEMIGHSSRRMMWPTRDACALCLRILRAKGSVRGWEQEFLKKSGEVFVTELSAQIWILNGKKLVVTTLVDITARKRAEEALRTSEERLRVLGDNLPNSAVFQYTRQPDGTPRFLYVSAGVERLNGVKAEDALTDANVLFGQIVPDQLRGVLEAENFSARELSVFECEIQMRLPDGQLRWIHVRARPRRLPDGCIIWDGVQSDISERKRAEEALRESESRFRTFFETEAVGTAEVDLNGRFVRVNQRYCQITGYSREELLGMSPADLTHPEDRDADRPYFQGQAPILDIEKRYIRKDGSVIWVHVTGAMIRDGEGNALRSAGVIQDITERKLAQESLLRAEKLAATGRMAATIAHEVNNPLAGATNSLYLASSDPALKPETKEYLTIADQELRRASHITQQTLGFYRASGSRTSTALPKLMDEVLGVYGRKLQNRNITVHRRYRCGQCTEGCEPCFLVSDGEMRQIISNLLVNGIDALNDDGMLYIRASRTSCVNGSGPKLHLTIADNGCGVRQEHLRRIFEPFFTTKKSFGTGLGLWVTQELVRQRNGSIKVRSREGKGTVFRITFPAAPCPSADERRQSRTAPLDGSILAQKIGGLVGR
jgi:PAS domain S-box-containing protein